VAFRESLQLLGSRFDFETDSSRLLRIVHLAYAHLPGHRFAQAPRRLRVKLVLTSAARKRSGHRFESEPPPVRALAGGEILCGAIDGASFVALSARERSALIGVSQQLLRYPYHVRYELLEFAVYVLAARVQGLIPLHAGCVGLRDQGILLIGASGSGKSTLVMTHLLDGFTLLAEDSVLVQPRTLRATGVASFLHLRPDSLRFLDRAARAALMRRAAVIRRRSGVRKLEIDLRHAKFRLAAAPQRIRAVLFLSKRRAGTGPLLVQLSRSAVLERLAASQRYAAHQPGWGDFTRRLSALPAYELRRARHPRESVDAVRGLLRAR
jgi:hypothetical protein